MNRTLFDCGIKREVETRNGRLLDVTATLPKSIELPKKHVKCEICNGLFTAEKYLRTHVRFKHNSNLFNLGKDSSFCNNHVDSGLSKSTELHAKKATSKEGEETNDEITIETKRNPQKPDNRRGRNQRKSYKVEFKVKTIELLDSLKGTKTKKKWQKWNKNRDKLRAELDLNKRKKNAGGVKAARQRRKLVHEKAQKSEKYPLAAQRLMVEFKLRRANGCKVSKLWLKQKMKANIELCYGKEEAAKFRGSSNWFQRFKKRHNISFRHRSNKKQNSADDGRETIQRFHRNLRKAVKSRRRRSSSTLDAKYGRWSPENRYNIDQVPLPFVVDQDKTYDVTGNKQVWVSQPSTGLDKRQATLQLCIRAEGEQRVKPAIVFRGKGNVSSAVRAEYDRDVDVYFQRCAWMDSEINMQWVSGTLLPGVGNSPNEKVIFADNVGFQQVKQFHEACREEINAIVYLLPENQTDKVQPIDAGYGKLIKSKVGEAMEGWLEKEANLEEWHDKLSAKRRRILMTQWTAQAWRELSTNKGLCKKLFEKTGCLMTADGSNDDQIRPQGLESYVFYKNKHIYS
ncbi:PREDICTED: jerky protein homolog-like [Priapulus caudatus]|uniref:Jerky protein homolog-like n=1 Tax=Priapulus caudatus TaxID=37621 RepID=A0ABM1ESU8_PRICU|nr:PREDICTED: jerky protein homolog-like [Priapulus caudatus]